MIKMMKIFFIILFSLVFFGVKGQWSSVNDGDYETSTPWEEAAPSINPLNNSEVVIEGDSVKLDNSLIIGGNNASTIDVKLDGIFVVTGTVDISKGNLIIRDGGKVEIFGSLADDAGVLTVESGGVLIIHTNLSLTQNSSSLDGDVVVLGNVSLKNTDMLGSANLVVGGTLSSPGGNLNDITGDVYLLDPDANPNPPALPNGTEKDLTDLINDGGDDPVFKDLVDDIMDSPNNIYTWDGTSEFWDEDTNWSSNAMPDTINSVVIPDSTTVSKIAKSHSLGIYVMWNLTLKNKAKLIIPSGSNVTIYGDVVIPSDASLIVESSNSEPSSFIVHGNISGNISFEWSYTPLHWFFIGHPISNPQMSVYRGILTDVTNPDNKYALYDYADDGSLINRANTPADFEFNQDATSSERIRGYQLKVLNATTISQTGIPNNNDLYSKPVIEGWQIIANPYPAYYQIPAASTDFEGTEKTVYVSDSNTNADKAFLTFNTTTGVYSPDDGDSGTYDYLQDGIIAPGQAFYIEGTTGVVGESIHMRKSNLVHEPVGESISLKSTPKTAEENILRLKLSNEHGLTDEAVIALLPNGDVALNTQDSKQMMYSGTSYSYIYSIVEDTKAVINVLPESLDDYQQTIGVKTKAGVQELKINGIDNLTGNYELVLEDKLTGSLTTMSNSTVYTFTAEEGEDHERFVLHFKSLETQVPTDIDDVSGSKNAVKIYIQDKSTLQVDCDWELREKTIEVFTVSGSLVLREAFEGDKYNAQLSVQPGIYIVKVSGGEYLYQQKVFVR